MTKNTIPTTLITPSAFLAGSHTLIIAFKLFQLSLLKANDLDIESNKVAITFKELRRHEIDRLRDEKPALLDRNGIQSKTLGTAQFRHF